MCKPHCGPRRCAYSRLCSSRQSEDECHGLPWWLIRKCGCTCIQYTHTNYTHNVYTQIYTCAQCTLYTCTNVHIYTHGCIHTNNGHIYANIHRCTHRAHTNIHTQIDINAYICIQCTHIYICTQKHTCTMYTYAFKHIIYYIYA